ncbi:MAG: hypothetical protein KUG58_09145 [Marinosulfonomonas sp.]|nr:hypothetical protein [Marinosulfonomonas sp.]
MTRQPEFSATSSLTQKTIAVIALVFGTLTLFSGGNVLFGPDAAQAWAGDYVGFVVWFNFGAGAIYVLAAIGLWLGKSWAIGLSALIAVGTAAVALGFAFVVLRGTLFEMRTVGALALRFGFWTIATGIAYHGRRRG